MIISTKPSSYLLVAREEKILLIRFHFISVPGLVSVVIYIYFFYLVAPYVFVFLQCVDSIYSYYIIYVYHYSMGAAWEWYFCYKQAFFL